MQIRGDWSSKYRSGVGFIPKPRRSGVGVELNTDPGWTGHYTKCRSGVTGLLNAEIQIDPAKMLIRSTVRSMLCTQRFILLQRASSNYGKKSFKLASSNRGTKRYPLCQERKRFGLFMSFWGMPWVSPPKILNEKIEIM